MRCSDTKAAYAALCEADPDVMDRDELAELTKHMADHRAWCDSLQIRITRRQRQLAADGRAEAPRDLLSREGRQSGKDARTADETRAGVQRIAGVRGCARHRRRVRRACRRHRSGHARPRPGDPGRVPGTRRTSGDRRRTDGRRRVRSQLSRSRPVAQRRRAGNVGRRRVAASTARRRRSSAGQTARRACARR